MTVGVVIITYNSESYVKDAMLSIIRQTMSDWRMVVVDDGSQDKTPEIARQLAENDHRISIVRQANGGPGAARNTGFSALEGACDSILFLDGDDALEVDALQALSARLEKEGKDVVGVYGLSRDMSQTGLVIDANVNDAWGINRREVRGFRSVALPLESPTTFRALVIWCIIQTPGLALVKTRALKSAGPWVPLPGGGEDWEHWLRVSTMGSFVMLPVFTLRKRVWLGSLSTDGRSLARSEPLIRAKLASGAYSPEQRSIARWGEFHAVIMKFSWSIKDLRAGLVDSAFRQFYRACRAMMHFFGRALRY